MNAPAKIETGMMTSKGQVLIPKAIRDAAGLVPGGPIKVTINDQGQVVVAPLGLGPEDAEARGRRMREGLRAVVGIARTGQSTDDYMRSIRGDFEP